MPPGTRLNAPTTIPAWLAIASPDGSLNSRDLRKLIGCSKSSLDVLISDGRVPAPDWRSAHSTQVVNQPREWRVRTIRNWIRANAEKASA